MKLSILLVLLFVAMFSYAQSITTLDELGPLTEDMFRFLMIN
jgi:hypothetical protein